MNPPWTFKSITEVCLRSFFILLVFASSIGKLLDNRGFSEVIATYQFGIPEMLLLPLALIISLAELALAIMVAFKVFPILGAQIFIVMHLGYTLLAIITNWRGLELTNCGCFGVFWARPMTWTTVIEDLILTLLSLAFLWSLPRTSNNRRV